MCEKQGGRAGRGEAGCPSSSVNSQVALQEGPVTVSIHEMGLRISEQTVSSTLSGGRSDLSVRSSASEARCSEALLCSAALPVFADIWS